MRISLKSLYRDDHPQVHLRLVSPELRRQWHPRRAISWVRPLPRPTSVRQRQAEACLTWAGKETRSLVGDDTLCRPPHKLTTGLELDPMWLVQLQTTQKAGLVVELRGTTASSGAYPQGWFNGQYENQRGVVKTVSQTAMSSGGTTTVTLSSGEEIHPPPSMLVPVYPENNQENAIVLTGHLKGQVVRTVNQENPETWVVLREGGSYEFLPETHMCKYIVDE
jgi:hypothetical protein